MNRRGFLGMLGVLAAVPLLPPAAAAPAAHGGVMYWVVVRCANPFVFGVKADSELAAFGSRALPARHPDPESARTACAALA